MKCPNCGTEVRGVREGTITAQVQEYLTHHASPLTVKAGKVHADLMDGYTYQGKDGKVVRVPGNPSLKEHGQTVSVQVNAWQRNARKASAR